MIFYYVLLLFLSWPQARGTEDADLKGEEIFDQIATASENVVHALRHENADSNNLEELPSAPSAVDASVHYENSNGFVPMIPSALPLHDDAESLQTDYPEQQDPNESEESSEESNDDTTIAVSAQDSSETRTGEKFEEDLAYSSEARIFLNDPGSLTNRRSFDFQEGNLNGFELLKVNNDTPAVANYQKFYENMHATVDENVNTAVDSEPDDASPSERTNGGKRTESYAHNYVRQSQQTNEEDSYAQYYAYNKVQDMKKTTYEPEKVAGNYRQQDTANHNVGHGQNAAPALSSSTRTNYKINELANSGSYDNIAEQSRARHRFSNPVVVADFNNDASDNEQKTSRNLEPSNSGESGEYSSSEYIERPRIRMQKSRRRPAYSDTTRKLPKEHRGTMEDNAEEDKQKYNSAKLRSQRYKIKMNPWLNDPSSNQDESIEDVKHTDVKNTKTRGKSKYNTWSQISPNLEISHSNGIELDHMDKPKYVVNLVPVASFDHATALGNSQGFDMSNAVLQNVVTAAPILSTPQSVLASGLSLSKNLVSTPVPDIIVGQSSFQNPVHTVLVSQSGQNGKDGLHATYLPSTMTPLFTVTSNLNPALQNIRVQNNVTPQHTAFGVTPAPTSVVQQVPIGPGVQQLLMPQPTVQTYSNFLQTPLQTNSEYQIQLNSHGFQGQNLIGHGNLQGLPTAPTALLTGPENRINVMTADSQKKNAYAISGANILATASMAVGQNDQKTINGNYYLQNAQIKDVEMTPRTKTYVQASQIMPTLLQIPTQQDAKQYIKLSNNMNDAVQQLQAHINKQLGKNTKLTGVALQSADSAGSHSNNVDALAGNAHLPNVVTKNVEIVNPNIKPSPIDTTMNHYYPTAVLTTPIPIFNTISPVPTQTVSLQNYVNSLTESGTKTKQLGADLRTSQNGPERPVFNPINFVPNIDILKDQNALNNKPSTNELVQQDLSLVPVMPGGNFFRPSLAAQNELVTKPKLTSDLQKYAEEMFKESLKTMYNSQKWNNDRRPQLSSQNGSESDITKLRLELQKLRASLSGDSRFRDVLETHQSESNIRTTDAPISSEKKKQDSLLETLEHLLKTKPRGPIHIFHGISRPGRKRKPGEPNFNSDFHDEFASDSHTMEFLTPPKHHFHSKGLYHEKPKKRPGSRYKNGPRKPIRPNNSPPRVRGALEASASAINIHLPADDSPYKSPFEYDSLDLDSQHQPSFDAYPTFTTSSPKSLGNILRELKMSNTRNKDYDINHPRMHNLLGLLMKNKQLPTRSVQNFRNKDHLRQYFESEKHRLQQQYYEDTLRDTMRDYLERSDRSGAAARSNSVVDRNIYINGTA